MDEFKQVAIELGLPHTVSQLEQSMRVLATCNNLDDASMARDNIIFFIDVITDKMMQMILKDNAESEEWIWKR